MAALEAGWDVSDQWRLGGTAEIAFENKDTTVVLPAYEVVNVFAAYKPDWMPGLELRLDARNLFDETYAGRSSDGLDSTRVVPLNEPGRTIGLTAKFMF